DDSRVIVDWTPAAVDQNGVFSAALTLPQGGWYRTLARTLDENNAIIEQARGTHRWGVGINILCIGQSNMVGQGQQKPYVTADDRVSNFVNEQWTHLVDPYAAGDTSLVGGGTVGASMAPALGNALVERYDVPVGILPAALNGASLMAEDNGWLKRTQSNPADRTNLYGNSLYRAQAAGGIEFIVMNQGENNVSRGTNAVAYRQGLQTLRANYVADLGYEVPLIYCQLGPAKANSWDDSRDPYITAIRGAQAAADDGVTLIMGASEMDLDRNGDNLHYTTASQAVIGQRIAHAIAYALGDETYYKGPEITSAAFANDDKTAIDVSIRHFGGSDITPAAGITGFEVFADGQSVPVSAAARKDAATVTLTLAQPANGVVSVRYLYGLLPDVSGLVKDNSAMALPLCPTNGAIPVEGSDPVEIEPVTLELEDIRLSGDGEKRTAEGFSGGGFWFINDPGKTASFLLSVEAPGTYDITLTDKDNADRGIYAVSVDDQPLTAIDFYNAEADFYAHSLGRITLTDTTAVLTLTGAGSNPAASGKGGFAGDCVTLTPVATGDEEMVLSTQDKEYTEAGGVWHAGAGETVRLSTSAGASAVWSTYPPAITAQQPRLDVYAYIPAEGEGIAQYAIESLDGRWTATVDQSTVTGWYKLATVTAVEDTALNVTVTPVDGNTAAIAADRIRVIPTSGAVDPQSTGSAGGPTGTVYVRVNQIGYEPQKSKRATVVNVANGTPFTVKNTATGEAVFRGTVQGGVADFTAYQPTERVSCRLECAGAVSDAFTVGKYLMQQASVYNALAFMEQSRADTYEMGAKGIGWRDSHQFSFEMSSLALQYMANPALYDRMPYSVYRAADCEYPELRVQDEPDIVWLMEFAALRYYDLAVNDGKHLHMLIKEQLAWFLYVYPYIEQYVSRDMYEKIRALTIRIWSDSSCNLDYHKVGSERTAGIIYYNIYDTANNREDNNLFHLQNVVGGIKGQLPLGHAIAPNLMMYEVLTRDGIAGADAYFQAAYDNAAWIVSDLDIAAPQYSKGQRMSEHVVMENLAYFVENYPDRAPAGLKEAITDWAQTMIARADNLWDMRMASSVAAGDDFDAWTGAAYADLSGQWPGCSMNEPGNMAGLQASMEAAARVVDDPELAARLRALGIAAIDDMFGRNPMGRAYFFNDDYKKQFAGADLGWPSKYNGGNGVLANVTGRIDASPKEAAYAGDSHCNPSANPGYTEAWVAYNTAWNSSLAYSAAADVVLAVSADSAPAGESVTVTLTAPLNMDPDAVETGAVRLYNAATGESRTLTLTEESADGYTFCGELRLADGDQWQISYGYGMFAHTATVTGTPGQASAVLYGDVDLDEDVDAADALMALQAATGKIVLSEEQTVAADVDGKAGVSAADALLILQYATGKIGAFPVDET
ncbi:MAG: sialate O-acetylesterase, partial [Acutalibacteraceae bacterium]